MGQYGAAAGGAIGNAMVPGVGGAVGALFGSFIDGGMVGGGGSSAPLNSQSAVYGSGLDGSGWAVNFQGVQSATSAPTNAAGIMPGSTPAAGLGGLGSGLGLGTIPTWFWMAAAGVILWKKSSSKR